MVELKKSFSKVKLVSESRYAHFHQVARQLSDSRRAMFLCQVQD